MARLLATPIPTTLLLFLAFLLLLLVSLSVPIIRSIDFFRLDANVSSSLLGSASGSITFGLWGYCVSAIDISVLSLDHSTSAECSEPQPGYSLDDDIVNALRLNDIQDTISRVTTAALVMHPISASLAFVAFFVSLFLLRNSASPRPSHRRVHLAAAVFTALAAVLATVALAIDAVFVGVTRSKINGAVDGSLRTHTGDVVWLVLAATISLWSAFLLLVYNSRRHSRTKLDNTADT